MIKLKCSDCGKEISISSNQCPKCKCRKPFNGYAFSRKELIDMGLRGSVNFFNFQHRGGEIISQQPSKYSLMNNVLYIFKSI